MQKTSIDELLEAVRTIQQLDIAIGNHRKAIAGIVEKLEQFEKRLAKIEAAKKP